MNLQALADFQSTCPYLFPCGLLPLFFLAAWEAACGTPPDVHGVFYECARVLGLGQENTQGAEVYICLAYETPSSL